MKKLIVVVLALALVLSIAAFAETLKIGATPAPHAEILEIVKPILAEQGIDLEIVIYNDYVIPNTAVEEGELDANYFQHLLYLGSFNEENGTHLVSVGSIHYEPFGIYAGKTTSLDELAEGAVIAVPNDPTNEARALQLLAQEGLITLEDGVGLSATVLSIVENPLNLEIYEVEAAIVPSVLDSVDVAVINGNYAIDAGLKVSEALAVEDGSSEIIQQNYANVLVVREGNEDNEAIQALLAALESEEVAEFIAETYDGAVVALF